MIWLLVFLVLAVISGLGIVVNVNRLRAERRVVGEMRALLAALPSSVARPPSA